MQQLTIKWEQSLTQQFPNWMDVVRDDLTRMLQQIRSLLEMVTPK